MLALSRRRPGHGEPAMADTLRDNRSGCLPVSTSEADEAVILSASFQRRACALCRERAEQAAVAVATEAPAGGEGEGANKSRITDESLQVASKKEEGEKRGAIAVLRFRANVHELYTLLQSVEVQPAGDAGEGEDGEPAFLPPGKRGWKHALLCEEAAGWADMAREGGEGSTPAFLWSAELPDFQVRSA